MRKIDFNIPQGATILDIGSFDGKDAAELAELFNTDVHCFEPVNHKMIEAMGNDRLFVWPFAVGNHEGGFARIYNAPTHPQSASIKMPKLHTKIFPNIKFNSFETVKIITLDKWAARMNIDNIDLIWCDVNGSEGDVIAGGRETLKRTHYLFIEFEEVELFAGALNRADICSLLPDWKVLGEYSFEGNYGNLHLENTKWKTK